MIGLHNYHRCLSLHVPSLSLSPLFLESSSSMVGLVGDTCMQDQRCNDSDGFI